MGWNSMVEHCFAGRSPPIQSLKSPSRIEVDAYFKRWRASASQWVIATKVNSDLAPLKWVESVPLIDQISLILMVLNQDSFPLDSTHFNHFLLDVPMVCSVLRQAHMRMRMNERCGVATLFAAYLSQVRNGQIHWTGAHVALFWKSCMWWLSANHTIVQNLKGGKRATCKEWDFIFTLRTAIVISEGKKIVYRVS